MIDITAILNSLAERRPFFHSEADFQYAFAWEINLARPKVDIRLEYPESTENNRYHIDVRIENKDEIIAVELKYKTLSDPIGKEQYKLKSHGAQDQGRYDFIKDIQRLEHVVHAAENGKEFTGYAILLTNDSNYWKGNDISKNTADAAFKIYPGRILNGHLNWTENTSAGTKKNREKEIELKGSYKVEWKDYKSQEDNYGFRYLAIKV